MILCLNPIAISELDGRRRWWVGAGSRWAFSMDRPAGSPGSYCPAPRDLMFVCQWLSDAGYDARLMDACAMEYTDYLDFFKDIDSLGPDTIVIDITTPQADLSLAVAKRLADKYKVVLVGSFASVMRDHMQYVDWADAVIDGGYEYGMQQYLDGRRGYISAKLISKADFQGLRPRLENAIERGSYTSPFLWREPALRHRYSERQLWLFSSKGCYMDCKFCLWVETTYNNKIVYKQADNFIRETEDLIAKHKPDYLMFDDCNFNCHPADNAREIVKWLGKTGLPWSILVSFDDKPGYDEEMLALYDKNGCAGLRVGMESMDQQALNLICPKKNVERQQRMLEFVMNHTRIPLFTSFQQDMLGSTPDGLTKTREAHEQLAPLYFETGGYVNSQYPVSMAFPGTQQAKLLADKGLWFDGNPMEIPWHKYLDGSTPCSEVAEMNRKYNAMLACEKGT